MPPDENEAPSNQSPETEEEVEEVDLGKMVSDAVEEATRPLKEEIEGLKKGSTTSPKSLGSSTTQVTPPSSERSSHPSTSSDRDIDAAVDRKLAEREREAEHTAKHAALDEAGSKPPRVRKGLSKLFWG